ncbi:MAG: hypothetical protein COB65_02850 [Thalassobium sp.]|nr:MAG: hypothetical protein COB65_02850 [Thalassobium sp.]
MAGDATKLEDLPLHPYFDNVNHHTWLISALAPGPMAVFLFEIDKSCGLAATELQRLEGQFEGLNLGELYTTEANEELAAIRLNLRTLLQNVGPNGVQEFLQDLAVSTRANQRNSWKTAMYEAAWQSGWFCGGGFDDPDLP